MSDIKPAWLPGVIMLGVIFGAPYLQYYLSKPKTIKTRVNGKIICESPWCASARVGDVEYYFTTDGILDIDRIDGKPLTVTPAGRGFFVS